MSDEQTLRIRIEGGDETGSSSPSPSRADAFEERPPQPIPANRPNLFDIHPPAPVPLFDIGPPHGKTGKPGEPQPGFPVPLSDNMDIIPQPGFPAPLKGPPPIPTAEFAPLEEPMAEGAQPKPLDLIAELHEFYAEIAELQSAMNPDVVKQRVAQEKVLNEERAKLEEAMERQRRVLDPKPMNDMNAEWEKFRKQMGELSEAMNEDNDIIRQRVKMEYALADAQMDYQKKVEKERERQRPTAEEIPGKPSMLDQILGLAKGARGTLGGMFGPVAGAGLDVASAASKHLSGGAGAAAGGEAAAGGMAAAAGPVGIAVAVIEAVKKLGDASAGAVHGLGQFTESLIDASDSPGRFVSNMGSAVEGFGDKVAYVEPILGVFAKTAGAAADELGGLMQAFDQMADRYANYSPEIAQAQAMADLEQTLGDMRRAQEIGPEMAQYIKAESALRQKIEDEKIKIMRSILPLVTTAVRVLEGLMPALDVGIDAIKIGVPGAIMALSPTLAAILQALFAIADNQEKEDYSDQSPGGDVLFGRLFADTASGVAPRR